MPILLARKSPEKPDKTRQKPTRTGDAPGGFKRRKIRLCGQFVRRLVFYRRREKCFGEDSSAVRFAVRIVFLPVRIQRGGQRGSTGCCQNGPFRCDNTAARTARQYRMLSESQYKGSKYSREDSYAVWSAVRKHAQGSEYSRTDSMAVLDAVRMPSNPRLFLKTCGLNSGS